jgi:hypothetical protein
MTRTITLLATLFSACGDNDAAPTTPTITTPSAGTETPEVASTPAEEPAAHDDDLRDGVVIPIVPGRSIGPIEIGMSRADIEALGILTPHPRFRAMTVPFNVYYGDDDRAEKVEVSFHYAPGNFAIGETLIARTASAEEALAILGDCRALEPARGATSYACREGNLRVMIGSGDPDDTWLRIGHRD